MITQDLHVHTVFSDGKNTAEEVAEAAITLGLKTLGFSDHSYAPYDTDCCIPQDRLSVYRAEIMRLKQQYAGRLRILLGIEQDLYSPLPPEGYDYVIGSMHYILKDGHYLCVDYTPQHQREDINIYFDGDPYAYAEAYYAQLPGILNIPGLTFIGHFDLVTKFNEHGEMFDPTHPRYVRAWRTAAEKLMQSGLPFEINTGAISRGWRQTPYPAADVLTLLKERGVPLLLSSDSHAVDTLAYQFDRWESLLDGAKQFTL